MIHPQGLEGHLYDWENALTLDRQNLDIAFYRQWLSQFPSNAQVLEFGCGTGRISLPLAQAGFTLTAADISRDRLDVARSLRSHPPNLSYVWGDMRNFGNEMAYDAVLIPYSTFLLLSSESDRLACLHCLARILKPAGKAVVDLSPNFLSHPPRLGHPELEGFCEPLAAQVALTVDTFQDYVQQITTFHKHYQIAPVTSQPFSFDVTEVWHSIKEIEMRWYLEQTPLRLESLLGTYTWDPLRVDGAYQTSAYKHLYILNKPQ